MFTSLDLIAIRPEGRIATNMWPKNYPLQNIQLSKNPPPSLSDFGEAGSLKPAKTYDASTRSSFRACLAEAAWAAEAGGEYRDRTGDLLVANQALSQLS